MVGVGPLRVRWLGRVRYREALAIQEAMFQHGTENHLLLLEHPHVFTHGPRADLGINVLVDPAEVGAELVGVRRGGDVTYHGPGQLVGYPILSLPPKHGGSGPPDSVAHVAAVEQLIIDTLVELGVPNAGRLPGYPGVWVDPEGAVPRKICAIGVRVSRGRTMHGFAINVTTDMRYLRDYIIPCGIPDRPVTSLAEEGIDVSLEQVVDVVARLAAARWGSEVAIADRQDVAWHHRPDDLSAFSRGAGPGEAVKTAADHGVAVRLHGRLASAGVTAAVAIGERKPEWLRPKVHHGPDVLALKRTVRDLNLITVCEEAGCPNLSECWADGTATFMVLGERCTCLLYTSPSPRD